MAYEYRCEICHELVHGADDEVLACPAHPSAGVMSCFVRVVADPVTIDGVTMTLQSARLVEFCGVNVAADVARVRLDGNCDGLLVDCLEGCDDDDDEAGWRDYVSAVCVAAEQAGPLCESGTATGEPCAWTGDADDLETVDWMPEHLRSSHEAAKNWGEYPYNGAERLRCCPACAKMLQAEVAS